MQCTLHCIQLVLPVVTVWFLDNLKKDCWFCSFISFLAYSLFLMRLMKKIFAKVLQSHIITVKEAKHGQVDAVAPGWSGDWWWPLSPGGSSGALWRWSSWQATVERCCSSPLFQFGGRGLGLRRKGLRCCEGGSCEEAEAANTRIPLSTVEAGNHGHFLQRLSLLTVFDIQTAPNLASGSLSKPIPLFLHFFINLLRASLLVWQCAPVRLCALSAPVLSSTTCPASPGFLLWSGG